nr:reverse transcriptase domain-containing protein [Tanacetum cinerariifolium]
ALNPADQDSLNAAAGGNLLERSTQDVLTIIENKSKVRNSRNKPIVSQVKADNVNSNSEVAKLTHAVNQQTSAMTAAMTAMLKKFQTTQPPAPVKAVEEICVTCESAHPYYQRLAAGGNTFPELRDNIQGYVSAAAVNYNHGNPGYRPQGIANQIRPPGFAQPNVQNNQNRFGPHQGFNRGNNFNQEQSYQATAQQNQKFYFNELEKIKRINETNMKATQNQIDMVKNELRNEMKGSIQTSLSNQTNEIKNIMASHLQMNTASGSGTLLSNTVANPKVKSKPSPLAVVLLLVDLPFPLLLNPVLRRDVFVPVGKFTFPADFVIVDYESDLRVPFILGRPFLRTARALIDVHGEETILHDGDERLTLNMRHDTSSYSNQPQRELVNLINIFNVSSEYFLEVLFSNQPSVNPTFSPHPELTSPEVTHDIFDSEGCTVLSEKLPDIDSIKDLHPYFHDNPLNKYFGLKDSIDQKDLANLDDIFVDPAPEMFTDEHAHDYSSPLIFNVYDDDFLEVESDAENVYDDFFNSKEEKIKESKLLIYELDLPCNFLPPSKNDSFISQDFSRVDALPSTNNKDK